MPQLARLVQVLNAQLMARLWQMVAPPEIFAGTALLALGSEGRGEQILKTDQDNALILAEGLDEKAVEQAANLFTEHMIRLGYPTCSGGIMVNQPLWRHTVQDWGRVLRDWARQSQGDPLMNLSIFLDAETITGPAAWLAACHDALQAGITDDATWLARMALPALQFHDQNVDGGFWWQILNREKNAIMDIKKIAIFPIVHGVRILSLEADVRVSNTFDRLEALVSKSILEKAFADDVAEALGFLMHLRLEAGLELLQEKKAASNEVDTSSLSTLDKDLLKDALLVVKRFKQTISQRYRLDRF
jgi:CBS domain-containing protein